MVDRKPTLYIMRGLPGSGKSTKANELLKKNLKRGRKTFRLNRDSIRKMIWPKYIWNPQFEEIVKMIELDCAEKLISFGFNVIIDDTNLKDLSMYKKFKNIKVYDYRGTSLETCLIRNEGRRKDGGNFCSPEIIVKLAKQNNLF